MNQVLRHSVSNAGESTHGTGANHHSVGHKRTTGNACGVVTIVMVDELARKNFAVAEDRTGGVSRYATWLKHLQFIVMLDLIVSWQNLLYVEIVDVEREAQLPFEDFDGSGTDRQMDGSTRRDQDFDKTNCIDGTTGARHRDYQTTHHIRL